MNSATNLTNICSICDVDRDKFEWSFNEGVFINALLGLKEKKKQYGSQFVLKATFFGDSCLRIITTIHVPLQILNKNT